MPVTKQLLQPANQAFVKKHERGPACQRSSRRPAQGHMAPRPTNVRLSARSHTAGLLCGARRQATREEQKSRAADLASPEGTVTDGPRIDAAPRGPELTHQTAGATQARADAAAGHPDFETCPQHRLFAPHNKMGTVNRRRSLPPYTHACPPDLPDGNHRLLWVMRAAA